jgi:WD40 repeat protein
LLRTIETTESVLSREVAMSSDGSRAATYDSSTVRLWDLTTGNLLATAAVGTSDGYLTIAFTPDDRRIIVGIQAAFDASTLRLIGKAPAHGIFSKDGRYVSCRNNGAYVIWNVDRSIVEAVQTRLPGDEHGYSAFNPEGTAIVGRSRWKKDVAPFDVGERPTPAEYWKRRRPDVWWGYAVIPAVWVAMLTVVGSIVSLIKDLRRRPELSASAKPAGT